MDLQNKHSFFVEQLQLRAVFLQLIMLAIVILLCQQTMLAGTGEIHGVVQGNGMPLVGATVRLAELDRVARTDARGEFTFAAVPSGEYNVFVRILGYASATNTVRVEDGIAETSFMLHESPVEEEEIVVSASPFPGTADEQYQPAQSRSMLDLHESAGSSFAEKISDMPGVNVRYMGSAPSRPMLRGLTDNEVLILEDGLRNGDLSTYDPAHAVPMEEQGISQIDVVRGPASIMFGPNAIGGLVNVLTNLIPSVAANPFSGSVSMSGNTVSDEYTGFFNGIYSNGGSAIGVSGGGLHSQDIHIPEAPYVDPGSGAAFNLNRMPQSFNHSSEGGLGYSHQGDFGMIGVGGKHYEMNYGIPGVPPNADWIDVPPGTSRIAQRKNSVELRGLLNVPDSFLRQVRLNANYVDYRHAEYPTAQDSTGISDPEANNFHKQTVNVTLQFQHRQTGAWQGTLGLWTNFEDLAISGDQPLGPNSVTTGVAGYMFEEYKVDEENRFQGALRFDYNHVHASPDPTSTDSVFRTFEDTRTSNSLTASVGALHKLSPEVTLSLNVGRSFRAPTVQELFANGLDAPSGTYTIGDATLSPETGIGIDVSLKGKFTDVSFELSPYLNFINNYLYGFLRGDTIMAFPVRQFGSTDARLMGFEASAIVQLSKNFAAKVSADYVNSEDTKNNVPLPFTPPLRGLLRLNYVGETYSGMVEWRLASSQTRLGDGETPTEGYGIVNIGAGARLVQDGVVHNVSLHCDNLFNQVYRDHLSVIKDFLPQPARGLRLNYELVF